MSRAIVLPLIPLAMLQAAIFFAGFVAPYAPDRQHREYAYAPPARLHLIDDVGAFHLRPFVFGLRARTDGTFEEDRSTILPIRFLVDGSIYQIAGIWTTQRHLFGVDRPGFCFLLGTDEFGRDQFSRFLWGGQVSVFAGLVAASLALGLGALLGAVSGYFGKLTDQTIMASTDLFLALPWLYLLLGVRAILPLDMDPRRAFLMIVAILGFVGWARPARLVRGVVLSARTKEFVTAARGFGASDLYLMRRHVLAQASTVLLTQAALLVPQYILAEVTMSFVGLGVSDPAVSWGSMLGELHGFYTLNSHWWMTIPAILLIPIFLLYYSVVAAMGGLDAVRRS